MEKKTDKTEFEIRYEVVVLEKSVVNGQRRVTTGEDWQLVLFALVEKLTNEYGTWATIKLTLIHLNTDA